MFGRKKKGRATRQSVKHKKHSGKGKKGKHSKSHRQENLSNNTEQEYEMFRSMLEKGFPFSSIEPLMLKANLDPQVILGPRSNLRKTAPRSAFAGVDTELLRQGSTEASPVPKYEPRPPAYPKPQSGQIPNGANSSGYIGGRGTRVRSASNQGLPRASSMGPNTEEMKTLRRMKSKKKVFIAPRNSQVISVVGSDAGRRPSFSSRVEDDNSSSVSPPVAPASYHRTFSSPDVQSEVGSRTGSVYDRPRNTSQTNVRASPQRVLRGRPTQGSVRNRPSPNALRNRPSLANVRKGGLKKSQSKHAVHGTSQQQSKDASGPIILPKSPSRQYREYGGSRSRQMRTTSKDPGQFGRTSFNELNIDVFMPPSPSQSQRRMAPVKKASNKQIPTAPKTGPGAFQNELQNTLRRRKMKKQASSNNLSTQASQNTANGDDLSDLLSPSPLRRSHAPPESVYTQDSYSPDPRMMFQKKRGDMMSGIQHSETSTSSRSQMRIIKQKDRSDQVSGRLTNVTRTSAVSRPLSERPNDDVKKAVADSEAVTLRSKNGVSLMLYPFDCPIYKKFKAMQVINVDARQIVAAMEKEGLDPSALYRNIDPNRKPHEAIKCDPEASRWELKYSKRYLTHYYQNASTGERLWQDEVERFNSGAVDSVAQHKANVTRQSTSQARKLPFAVRKQAKQNMQLGADDI